jgi:GNAT superfamily N-acetyltransferase
VQKLTLGSDDLADIAVSVLSQGGSISFIASGASMLPTLRDGDLLRVERIEPGSISAGDIILHSTGMVGAAVHRVRSVDGDVIRMACDSRPWSTYTIGWHSVLGIVTAAEREGRDLCLGGSAATGISIRVSFLIRALRSPAVRLAGIATGAVTRFKPVRRLYSGVMGRIVEYQFLPWSDKKDYAGDGMTSDLVLARLAGRTVGSAELVRFPPGTPYSRFLWLFSMRVSRPFRGAGIGRRLTRMIVERASETSDRDLCLAVLKDNDRAIGLYRSMGFSELDSAEIPDGVSDRLGTDKLIMIYRK